MGDRKNYDRIGPLPDRWLACPRQAKTLIEDKFLAFKTPLGSKFDQKVPIASRFTPSMLLTSAKSKKMNIGLWIDLTKTTRFYDKREVEEAECSYLKITCQGHGGAPSVEQTHTFISACSTFIAHNPLHAIAVHCTHGFNRTGFMIISYLVEKADQSIDVALQKFAAVRPPGIYKEEYIRELYRRYDDDADAPPPPQLPPWYFEEVRVEDDDDEHRSQENGKVVKGGGKKKRYKENPMFMKGVPGVEAVTDRKKIDAIQLKAQQLCGTHLDNFPGSQPVSMSKDNLLLLSTKPYRVSWKADGTRYVMLIQGKDEVYFLDRDNSVFKVRDIRFFHRKNSTQHLCNTLLDGEMVIDKVDHVSIPRYLIYDIVSFESHRIGDEPFYPTRLHAIDVEIIQPRITALKEGRIIRHREPFSIRAKQFYDITQSSYLLGEKFAKQLSHDPDGLIYQPSDDPYTCGVSPHVLKWKPLAMNSVDFLLEVQKETREGYANQFVGILKAGNNVKFGEIKCSKAVKALHGKIIECKFENNQWVLMRERTDKSFPNSYDTARSVFNSIRDPVTKEILLQYIDRHRWKDPMPPPSGPPIKRQRVA